MGRRSWIEIKERGTDVNTNVQCVRRSEDREEAITQRLTGNNRSELHKAAFFCYNNDTEIKGGIPHEQEAGTILLGIRHSKESR